MKAIGDRVLIQEIEYQTETKRDSGIITIENEDKRVHGKSGKVMSVGERVKDIAEGDTVYYNYYDASHPFKIDNKIYYTIADNLIWAKWPTT